MGKSEVRRYLIAVDLPENATVRVSQVGDFGAVEVPIVWMALYQHLGTVSDHTAKLTEAEWQDLGRPRDHGEQ